MENYKDNIELRSDKVRSIIGQIPPWIIRSGIIVIFLVNIALLVGSYYFKYPYSITAQITFVKMDNSFTGIVEIPANEISKVHKGQNVEITFNNVKNMNGKTFSSKLKSVLNKLIIAQNKGYYQATIKKIDNLKIIDKTIGMATIKTEEVSFFDRIINPIKSILHR